MGAERQLRPDDRELKALAEELERPEVELGAPGKQTLAEQVDRLALILRHRAVKSLRRTHGQRGPSHPGQRALVGEMLTAVPKLEFSDCRALALRDVLSRLSRHGELHAETLAAADPHVAQRVAGRMHGAHVTPQGQAMWGAANQRAVTLYRRATAAGIGAPETRPVAEALDAIGTGTPLPIDVRRKLEAALGVSLENVRLHTGAVARDAAVAVCAEAFTVGEDIFFPSYDPTSSRSQETLAHEVVHCIQWRQGRIGGGAPTAGGPAVSRPDDPLEREAEQAAKSILSRAFQTTADSVAGMAARREKMTAHAATSLDPTRITIAEGSRGSPSRRDTSPMTLAVNRPMSSLPVGSSDAQSPVETSPLKVAPSGPMASVRAAHSTVMQMIMRKAGTDDQAAQRPIPQWRAEIPIGFIDHRDGADVFTAPPEQGGKVTGKLAPTAKVWVNGIHPAVKDWMQVTEVPASRQTAGSAGTAMMQGYVRAARVVTRLPEPSAELYQVTATDTPEKLAARKYGHLVRPGRDLRFYENVLLYVNRQEKRKGVSGTAQTADVFGQRSNGIQLEAGERIWLVSPQYAELFAGIVETGSLTGGMGGSGKHAWYQNPVLDVFKSSLWAPQHTVEDVAGEYADLLTENMGAIAGTIGALLVAEAAAWGALAIPVCGPVIATMLQLGIAAFGIVVTAQALEAAAEHGKRWIELAWTARGDEELLDEASREWWRMWLPLFLVGGAGKGTVRSIRKAGKYFNMPPRAGKGQSANGTAGASARDLPTTKSDTGVYQYSGGAAATSRQTAAAPRSATPSARTSSKTVLLDDGLGIPAMVGGAPGANALALWKSQAGVRTDMDKPGRLTLHPAQDTKGFTSQAKIGHVYYHVTQKGQLVIIDLHIDTTFPVNDSELLRDIMVAELRQKYPSAELTFRNRDPGESPAPQHQPPASPPAPQYTPPASSAEVRDPEQDIETELDMPSEARVDSLGRPRPTFTEAKQIEIVREAMAATATGKRKDVAKKYGVTLNELWTMQVEFQWMLEPVTTSSVFDKGQRQEIRATLKGKAGDDFTNALTEAQKRWPGLTKEMVEAWSHKDFTPLEKRIMCEEALRTTVSKVEEKYGVARVTIRGWFDELDIRQKPPTKIYRTKEQEIKILKYYDTHSSVETEKKFNVSLYDIQRFRAKHNWPSKYDLPEGAKADAVRDMEDQDIDDLANQLGRNPQTLHRWKRELDPNYVPGEAGPRLDPEEQAEQERRVAKALHLIDLGMSIARATRVAEANYRAVYAAHARRGTPTTLQQFWATMKAKALALHDEGLTEAEIATKLELELPTVRQWIELSKVPAKTAEEEAAAVALGLELVDEGLTMRQAADIVGVRRHVLQRAVWNRTDADPERQQREAQRVQELETKMAQALFLIDGGLTAAEAARRLTAAGIPNVEAFKVRYWDEKRGRRAAVRQERAEKKARARELVQQGMTAFQAAKEVGLDYTTFRSSIKGESDWKAPRENKEAEQKARAIALFKEGHSIASIAKTFETVENGPGKKKITTWLKEERARLAAEPRKPEPGEEEALRYIAEGHTIYETAKKFGLKFKKVQYWHHRSFVKPMTGEEYEAAITEGIRLMDAGVPCVDAAKTVGMHQSKLARWYRVRKAKEGSPTQEPTGEPSLPPMAGGAPGKDALALWKQQAGVRTAVEPSGWISIFARRESDPTDSERFVGGVSFEVKKHGNKTTIQINDLTLDREILDPNGEGGLQVKHHRDLLRDIVFQELKELHPTATIRYQVDEDFAYVASKAREMLPPDLAAVYTDQLWQTVYGDHQTPKKAQHHTDASPYIATELPLMAQNLRARLKGELGLATPFDNGDYYQSQGDEPRPVRESSATRGVLTSREFAERALKEIELVQASGVMSLLKYKKICTLYGRAFGFDETAPLMRADVDFWSRAPRDLHETNTNLLTAYDYFDDASAFGIGLVERPPPNEELYQDEREMNFIMSRGHDAAHHEFSAPMPSEPVRFLHRTAEQVRFRDGFRKLGKSLTPDEQRRLDEIWFDHFHEGGNPPDAPGFYERLRNNHERMVRVSRNDKLVSLLQQYVDKFMSENKESQMRYKFYQLLVKYHRKREAAKERYWNDGRQYRSKDPFHWYDDFEITLGVSDRISLVGEFSGVFSTSARECLAALDKLELERPLTDAQKAEVAEFRRELERFAKAGQ